MEEVGEQSKSRGVGVLGLFAFADETDKVLMIVGSIGSCVHGAALSLFFVIFAKVIHSLGSLATDPLAFVHQVSKDAVLLVYLGLGILFSAWIGISCWIQTGERQAGRMREKFLRSVLGRDISFFDVEAKDENIVFCISSDSILVQDAIGDKMGHALRFLSQFLAGFAVAFSQVWKLTLITVAVVPLLAAAGALYAIALSTLSKKGEAAYAEAGKFAEEVISQVSTVYSFVGEDKAVHTYSNLLRNALKLGKKSGFVKGFGLGVMYAVMFCSWGLLLWQASVLVSRHSVDGAKAFMTIVNVVYSGFALGQAIPNLADIAKGRAAIAKMISLIDPVDTTKQKNEGNILPKVNGQIDFCKVTFAYPSRSTMVFEALSFSVNHGKTVAIVGQSGSGKSTIVSLIERFYEPNAGKILLDGHDLKSLQLKWLREQIGLVSQEPALFATTIAKNILLGKEDASMDEIMEAAKVSNAHSFIQSFPNGYDTQVGDGGTLLSGGQKQRIAVARAILRNPKILLLDEATSALDAESELLVQQALNNIMSKRTTIVIAHKMSTIRNVDTIIVLKNGQVFESGNHAELMAKEKAGEYATLVKMQLLSNDENDGQQDSFGTSILEERQNNQTLTKSTDANDIQMSDQEVVSAPSFWKLVKLNTPEWPFALLGSLGAVLTGIQASIFALGVARILELFYLYDDSKTKHESLRIILSFIIMAVFTVPLYLMQHFFCTIMGERLVSRVRLYMFSAMLRNEISWFDMDTNSTGSLISTLAADATLVRSALAERLSSIVQNIAITLSAFAIGYKLCWPLALVVTATFPLLIAASITEKLVMQGLGGDYSKAYSRAIALAHEAIINIQTVAAFGSEDMITNQFSSELSRSNKWALLRGHITAIGFGMSQCLAFFSYALGLWYSSILIKNHGYKFGDAMKTFLVLIFTANSIADTLGVAPDIVKGTKALESVFRILERRTKIEPNDPTSLELTEVKGNVELKNVIFRYPSRPDVVVLDDFNLKVMAGTSHAIVGHSGCGKSSVIALIMRFYEPTSGSVMIDGLDIRSLNLKSTRLRIGLVQQEPVLFSTSVYDNILYGKDGASEIEIINAAKAANAHEFISRMPDGYHTQVGTQGAQLSGGQKQRVAIARAILKDPTILLLDEATSALDTTSEKLVQEALDKLMEGRTTIIVAHRQSTIRDVNTISVLQGGKVVETGNHGRLLDKAALAALSTSRFNEESGSQSHFFAIESVSSRQGAVRPTSARKAGEALLTILQEAE
ncbi:hypothetical protein Scep_000307 [Stephania cephalantha]|uniref:Uncharacterized protein n=1 Tax=Stephania cephalantha TaxID=152367 RepID=A0AAP0Q6J6_9MAGN